MNVIARKYNLINQIIQLSDEESLRRLETFFQSKSVNGEALSPSDDLLHLVQPLRKKLDLEELKREQHYKGVDRKRFDRLVKEIDIQESAEELLEMLTA